eukprot:6515369-Pyramimonas_sp.AAC.1
MGGGHWSEEDGIDLFDNCLDARIEEEQLAYQEFTQAARDAEAPGGPRVHDANLPSNTTANRT